jgi:hypothetical protein
MLAPATLATVPSTRAIPNRDVFYVAFPKRSIPSLAACSISEIPLKLVRMPALSPLPVAALPSISKFPFPQFLD